MLKSELIAILANRFPQLLRADIDVSVADTTSTTLPSMGSNPVSAMPTRVDIETIERLCGLFNCQVGNLFEFVRPS